MKKRIFAIFIIVLLLSSCMLLHPITEGEIIEKTFIAEHYENYIQVIGSGTGSFTISTPIYIPDTYMITIANQGEIRKLYIPKDVYDSLSIGDWYII